MGSRAYTTTQLAQAAGASLLGAGQTEVKHLLTDSRRLLFPAHTLFFAVKTGSNDGHRYVADLYASGVRAFAVQHGFDASPFAEADFLVAENVLLLLQKIAAFHRQQFAYPVVGITGSNGKTVVKEWLYQLLQGYLHVVRSPRSYNSQIGVPLSLWQMDDAHEVALIEAGISQAGEMEKLEAMIKPGVGIFTNLGHAHDAGFTSLANKAIEKARLFRNTQKIIFCRDAEAVEAALVNAVNGDESRLLAWSFTGKAHAIKALRSNNRLTLYLDGAAHDFKLPFTDAGSVENCVHALLCAWHLGVPIVQLQDAVAQLSPVEMRLQERKGVRGNLLINDFYNSDPESVRIAIDLLRQQPINREKIVVISAFDGLSPTEKEAHYARVVALLNSIPLKLVVLVGADWAAQAQPIAHTTRWFATIEALLAEMPVLDWQNAAILLKGARKFAFEKLADALQEQIHQTWLEVNLSAMANNLRYYRSLLEPKTKVMAMVKALSYGSGTIEIARWLQYNRVDYLAVAYVDEGITLRQGGITLPILVMNPDPAAFSRLIDYQLEPEVYSLDVLRRFLTVLHKEYSGHEAFPIHVKLETGMHRLGFEEAELPEAAEMLKNNPKAQVASVFSHLAASDSPQHDDFTRQQIAAFKKAAKQLEQLLGYKPWWHLANTSGVARFKEAQFNMVRLGIGLYGVGNSESEQQNLQLVSRWFTRVSQLKTVQVGESVGYGRSYIATKKTTIATLPVGYADGYFRLLGNGAASVCIGGKRAPVVGRVCMDMLMVDVTGLPVTPGDEVELMGENITAKELANVAQTIPYEIFTHISPRVPRVYVSE